MTDVKKPATIPIATALAALRPLLAKLDAKDEGVLGLEVAKLLSRFGADRTVLLTADERSLLEHCSVNPEQDDAAMLYELVAHLTNDMAIINLPSNLGAAMRDMLSKPVVMQTIQGASADGFYQASVESLLAEVDEVAEGEPSLTTLYGFETDAQTSAPSAS